MRQLAMRDFQQKGQAAIDSDCLEPILISGRSGPKFFLVPVQEEDIDLQFEELMRAQAISNLRAWQLKSKELGLNKLKMQEINSEIKSVRAKRSKNLKK